MSCCKFVHNFCYMEGNQIPLKTHLWNRIALSIGIWILFCSSLRSEKISTKTQSTCGLLVSNTCKVSIDNISQTKKRMKFCEKPILDIGEIFSLIYGVCYVVAWWMRKCLLKLKVCVTLLRQILVELQLTISPKPRSKMKFYEITHLIWQKHIFNELW